MSEKKEFKASKLEYGDNVVKFMNKNLPLNSTLRVGFDWGNTGAGARQLATAMLKEAGNQTIARIYTTKYTNAIIKNLKRNEWVLDVVEVQKWINDNTEYSVEEDTFQEEEKQRLKEEKLKLKREEDRKKKEARELFQRKKEKTQEEQKLKLKREKEIKAQKAEEARAKKDKLEEDKKIKEELEALKKEKLLQEQKYKKELKQKEKELLSAKEEAIKSKNNDIYDENIIENICNELDISQDKLGKILGVTRNTVQNWKLENEIPKLAKKAMEFYKQYTQNQNDTQMFDEELKEYKLKATKYQDELDEYKQKATTLQNELDKHKDLEDLYSEEIDKYKQEVENYKEIVSMLDIPSLYKRYSTLNGVSKA